MDINELKDLLKRENRALEFKSTTGEIHKACKTLCAFLNGQGGVVLIGVKNDGRIVGQMVTDPTNQEIANDIRKIEPPVNVDVSYIPVEGNKFVISMDVPPGIICLIFSMAGHIIVLNLKQFLCPNICMNSY